MQHYPNYINDKGKKEKVDVTKIKEYGFEYNNIQFTYQLIKWDVNSAFGTIGEIEGFCKLIIDGKCKLYYNFEQVKGTFGGQKVATNYLIVKGDSKPYIFNNSTGGKMIEKMQNKTTLEDYFSNCENLVTKLKKKEFKKDKYIESVKYYNENCGDK